jgi:CBS domain-containing protein
MTRYVQDVMSTNPVMVGATHETSSALREAERRGVHHVVVMDGCTPVGVVSVQDLNRARPEDRVASLIQSSLVTIDDQLSLDEAVAVMDWARVDCVPVVDWSGLLRGVVTRGDAERARARGTQAPRHCAACGSRHGLISEPDAPVAFCAACLDQARPPTSPIVEETYFTLGGYG